MHPEDVLVLTETKATAGSQFLAEAFAAACPRERPVLVDLFRYLHPERVEHSWARRAELGYRYDHATARTPASSGSRRARTSTRPGT